MCALSLDRIKLSIEYVKLLVDHSGICIVTLYYQLHTSIQIIIFLVL